MGLDITVYMNPTPATDHELAILNAAHDPEAALVAYDALESEGRFADLSPWRHEQILARRVALMRGQPSPAREEPDYDLGDYLGLARPRIYPEFVSRAHGIEAAWYRPGQTWGFRAGSYSGYNRWRSDLAMAMGIVASRDALTRWWDDARLAERSGREPSEPFWQLVHFSDAEGTIGPVVSAKLARDFAAHRERAEVFAQGMDVVGYWMRTYDDFARAFVEAGSTGGWVSFH